MRTQAILELYIVHQLTRKQAAKALDMHENAVSRLKKNYEEHGFDALLPKTPGPKKGTVIHNRTDHEVEDLVCALGVRYPNLGPVPLSEKLLDDYGIRMDGSTVWRILKRRAIRYTKRYKRFKQDPTLYALDKPGKELQMDASYPFGRERDIAVFSAIDDCSRWVFSWIYEHEDDKSAIAFVTDLVKRAPFRISAIRVDNRYGKRFKNYCETLGISVITNPPYSPEKNGKIERFHKTLKREFFWPQCSFFDPKASMQYKLNLWLHHYNYQRRHGGYKMNRMTPAQKIASTSIQLLSRTNYPQEVTGTVQQYMY